MKRYGIALFLFLAFICTIFPQKSWAYEDNERVGGTVFHRHLVSMDVWTGYTYLNMGDLNQLGHDYLNTYRSFDSKLTEVHSGVNTQIDVNFEVVRGLKFGPRLGVIVALPGGVTADDAYGDTEKWQFNGVIVPVGVGVSYSVPPLSRCRFTFGLDTGLAFGTTNWSNEYYDAYYNYTNQSNFTATANSAYVNVYGALRIIFTEAFGMDFKLGYHVADMNDWTVTSSSSSGDVGKKVYNGNKVMDVDFSGVDALVGFSFYF
jgi:hypothetical protein